ncbi:hypothetical protein [Nocardia sp. NPDC004722]
MSPTNSQPAHSETTMTNPSSSDPTDPGYYIGRAPAGERQMRADFARAYQAQMAYLNNTHDSVVRRGFQDSLAIEEHYATHPDPGVVRRWSYLGAAADSWASMPETMTQAYDHIHAQRAAGNRIVNNVEWRSQQQARALTGNGEWMPGSDSAATGSEPLNAFAVAADRNLEREGAER